MLKKLFKIKHNRSFIKRQAGMTLVELLVVLAIFLIVASITIFDYGRFKSSVSLQNLADDITLSIRRAQSFAIGVRSGQSSVFSSGYGIHFSTATPSSSDTRAGSNKTFIIFSDLDNNHSYNYSTSSSTTCNTGTLVSGDECIDMLNITSNDIVQSICPNGINCAAGYTDITFLRPNPDAYICTGSIGGACSLSVSSVSIIVKNSLSQNTKVISISNVGQINVK